MFKSLAGLPKFLFNIAFIVIVIGSYVIVAQTPVTGEWKANTRSEKSTKKADDTRERFGPKGGDIHISFERSRGEKSRSQHGSSFDYSELQGLTAEQTQNGRVSFRLVREAGTVECEGTFVDGKGSGTFRFVPDPGYLSAMSARGFDFSKTSSKHADNPARHAEAIDDRMFSAALLNVTTALADDLRSVNLGTLDVDDLFKASIFKVDSKFMAEMKASGFPDLTMEDLVKARIFKIDADYVRQVHQMGFSNKGFEGLVKFRIFKVTPEFLNDLRANGFDNLSSEEIVKFRIFNIDPEFIRQAKAENPSVTVEEMVEMKIGVRRMKRGN
jgi:hypothetical protein